MVDYRQNKDGIWVGEKAAISKIREFMSYDIELKICPYIVGCSNRRHLSDFNYFRADHNAFDSVDKIYLDYARKMDA